MTGKNWFVTLSPSSFQVTILVGTSTGHSAPKPQRFVPPANCIVLVPRADILLTGYHKLSSSSGAWLSNLEQLLRDALLHIHTPSCSTHKFLVQVPSINCSLVNKTGIIIKGLVRYLNSRKLSSTPLSSASTGPTVINPGKSISRWIAAKSQKCQYLLFLLLKSLHHRLPLLLLIQPHWENPTRHNACLRDYAPWLYFFCQ